MDRVTFEGLVKEIVANLYDYAALETHPLVAAFIKPPEGLNMNKVEYLRQLILETIDELRPPGKEYNQNAVEWRPYVILHRRYTEGASLQDLTAYLSISDRQLRRDHHRALRALTSLLWDKLSDVLEPSAGPDAIANSMDGAGLGYEINWERIDVVEVIQGVARILKRRLDEEGLQLETQFPPQPAPVLTDRIILRQLLIGLLNVAFHIQDGEEVRLQVTSTGQQVEVTIEALEAGSTGGVEGSQLKSIQYWSERINASFHSTLNDQSVFTARLGLPLADQKVVLVIDDQLPAVNMIGRYLSRTEFMVAGATRSEQVLALASQLNPALIILDVMMPVMDGWEILQSLKLQPQTHDIPVVICSAWEEPELARSLGAAYSLKKPITQKMLMDALQQLDLLA